jgi:exodeoxyribonuclease VII small subunit
MPSKDSKVTYEQLNSEIENIMAELSREDLDVDLAVKYYERGLELVADLQNYLNTAENKITELKAKFDK